MAFPLTISCQVSIPTRVSREFIVCANVHTRWFGSSHERFRRRRREESHNRFTLRPTSSKSTSKGGSDASFLTDANLTDVDNLTDVEETKVDATSLGSVKQRVRLMMVCLPTSPYSHEPVSANPVSETRKLPIIVGQRRDSIRPDACLGVFLSFSVPNNSDRATKVRQGNPCV
jgi:hypothetical protein